MGARAVGDPTDENIQGVQDEVERTVSKLDKLREKRARALSDLSNRRIQEENTQKEEEIAHKKMVREQAKKRAYLKDAMTRAHVDEDMVWKMKDQKVRDDLKASDETIEKWKAHERRKENEAADKKTVVFKNFKNNEVQQKTMHKDVEKERLERCDVLLRHKLDVKKRRQEAIDALGTAKAKFQLATQNTGLVRLALEKHTAAAEKRRVEANQERLNAMNEEAADADVQVRACAAEAMRRRRTCVCDDPDFKGNQSPKPQTDVLLQEEAQPTVPTEQAETPATTGYTKPEEVKPWIRRRQTEKPWQPPSPVDRRRAYVYATAAPDQPRSFAGVPGVYPGVVCPCCGPGQRPKTDQCMLRDMKEMVLKNEQRNRRQERMTPSKQNTEDPRHRFRVPGSPQEKPKISLIDEHAAKAAKAAHAAAAAPHEFEVPGDGPSMVPSEETAVSATWAGNIQAGSLEDMVRNAPTRL